LSYNAAYKRAVKIRTPERPDAVYRLCAPIGNMRGSEKEERRDGKN